MWWALGIGVGLGISAAGHCAAMCGPINLALPFRTLKGSIDFGKFWLYHLGRMSTYLLLGLLVGLADFLLSWREAGAWISMASGFGLVYYALNKTSGFTKVPSLRLHEFFFIAKLWERINKPNVSHFWYIPAGAANGLLPCGMVYAAVLVAVGLGGGLDSLGVMAGFGLGTMPIFVLFPVFGAQLAKYRKWFHWILITTGVWMVLRGIFLLLEAASLQSEVLCTQG